MKQPRVVVTVADRRIRKILVNLLRASYCNVKMPRANEVWVELERDEQCALMILDSGFIERAGEEQTAKLIAHVRGSGGKILMISEGKLRTAVPHLFRNLGVTNLVAKSTEIAMLELLVTVNKLMNPDIFGIEKYLPWGTRVVARTVHDSERRVEVSNELNEFVKLVGCGARMGDAFIMAADELVTNAIYNAPVDDNGKPMFRSVPRTERVVLPAGAEVSIKYSCDGQHLVVGVTDNYGSLERETLIGYLERCFARGEDQIENKQGGAGLGLFMVFDSLNTFVVNIVPGQRTEMIGFIEISGSYQDYVALDTSFHIFTNQS